MNRIQNDSATVSEFMAESKELLETLETRILELKQSGGDPERINTIFRILHAIRGTSSFIGLGQMSELAHKTADILDGLGKNEFRVSHEIVTLLLRSVDILGRILGELGRKQESKTDEFLDKEDSLEKENLDWIDTGLQLLQLENLLISKSSKTSSRGVFFKRRGGPKREHAKKTPKSPMKKGKRQILAETMKTYIEETGKILGGIEPVLLELERNPEDEETIYQLFRSFHTIKGSSDYIGIGKIEEIAQLVEDVLDLIRRGLFPVTPSILNILHQAVDVIKELVLRLAEKEDLSGIAEATGELLKFVFFIARKSGPGTEEKSWKEENSLRSFFVLAENFFIPMRTAMGELGVGKKAEKNLGFLKLASLSLKNGAGFMMLENVFSRAETLNEAVERLTRRGLQKNLLRTLQSDFAELEHSVSQTQTGDRQSRQISGNGKTDPAQTPGRKKIQTATPPKRRKNPSGTRSALERNRADQKNRPKLKK